jgi:D-glycero-D-manno-heptose 1,7-bisphosphate phosphatase
MNKAVFLDRDGVINREMGEYTYRKEDFVLNEGLAEALKIIQEKGFLLIIISNQGGISKGIFSNKEVEALHNILVSSLSDYGVKITDFFYCPHHSDVEACLCRKPGSLLIEKAIALHNIDPFRSYMIGDHDRDMLAGQNAGLRTIKVTPNQNLMEILCQIN